MANNIGLPKEINLTERLPPKKSRGVFLLIPLLLAGLMWMQANTGLDKSVVQFYILLLLTASASLTWVVMVDPKTLDELRKIKPFFFTFAYILLFAFVIGFIFVLVYANTGGRPNFLHTSWEIALNFIGMQMIIVAPVETIMFQVVLPKTLTISLSGVHAEGLSWGVSQLAFGFFHWGVYGGDVGSLASAVMLGIVFLTLVKLSPVYGIGCAMGAHASVNICITFFQLSSIAGVVGSGGLAGIITNSGFMIPTHLSLLGLPFGGV